MRTGERDQTSQATPEPERPVWSIAAPHGTVAWLQTTIGNRATSALLQRQRGRPRPVAPAAATVTRIILVTIDSTTMLDAGGGTRVPQQEIFDRLARQRAAAPAPGGGRTEILRARTVEQLEAQLRALAAAGARVSQIDYVGHGLENGFILAGRHAHAAPGQWITPDDIGRLSAIVAQGQRTFASDFSACYVGQSVHQIADRLRRNGIPNPVVRGTGGVAILPYGPLGGRGSARDRSNWVVGQPPLEQSSADPPPRLSPSDLGRL